MNSHIHIHCVGLRNVPPYARMFEQSRRVFATDAVSPAMHTFGGHLEIKILIEFK